MDKFRFDFASLSVILEFETHGIDVDWVESSSFVPAMVLSQTIRVYRQYYELYQVRTVSFHSCLCTWIDEFWAYDHSWNVEWWWRWI